MGRKPVPGEVVRIGAAQRRLPAREPLTHKALSAVECYAEIKVNGDGRRGLVGRAVEAERMERAMLYRWLAWHGYVWVDGKWSKKGEDHATS